MSRFLVVIAATLTFLSTLGIKHSLLQKQLVYLRDCCLRLSEYILMKIDKDFHPTKSTVILNLDLKLNFLVVFDAADHPLVTTSPSLVL